MTALSRDHGTEHQIEVLVQRGLVVLRHDEVIRLLAPRAAIEPAMELITATMPSVPPNPISASY
jgi:hypothetical protein